MGMGAFFSSGPMQGESEEMKQMRLDAEWLKERSKSYGNCSEHVRWVERWFLESADGVQKHVQDEDGDAETIRLSKTHSAMVKFPNGEDEDWKKVKSCLIRLGGSLEQ
jgi:hypothetical protein